MSYFAFSLTGVKKSLADYGVTSGGDSKPAAGGDDDDFELFGSDDEVLIDFNWISVKSIDVKVDEEAEKAKAERVKAYNEKKSKSKYLFSFSFKLVFNVF